MGQGADLFRRAGHSLLRGGLLAAVLLGPMIVGVMPWQYAGSLQALAAGAALGFLFSVLWIQSGSTSPLGHVVVGVIVSCFLTVTLLDVVARPLLLKRIAPQAIIDWPPMPLVKRYQPNVRFQGTIYGEMARDRVMKRYREYRDGTFITDRFGYRNEETSDAPLDVIIVGPSFAMGDDTGQSETWATLLSKAHGLHVYNLGVGGYSPWQEFTDLTLAVDRLRLKPEGTVVLWMLFTSRDVSGTCYSIFDKDRLPWRRGVRGVVRSLPGYQKQSPWRILWARTTRTFGNSITYTGIIVKPFLDGTDILFDEEYAKTGEMSLDRVRGQENYACGRQTIAAMSRFAGARHLKVAIMVAPSKEEVYSWVLHGDRPWSGTVRPSGYASAVRAIAREEHIPFVDMKPALIQASERVYRVSKALLYWRDDTHWNVEGNREAATIAYDLYRSVTSGKPSP